MLLLPLPWAVGRPGPVLAWAGRDPGARLRPRRRPWPRSGSCPGRPCVLGWILLAQLHCRLPQDPVALRRPWSWPPWAWWPPGHRPGAGSPEPGGRGHRPGRRPAPAGPRRGRDPGGHRARRRGRPAGSRGCSAGAGVREPRAPGAHPPPPGPRRRLGDPGAALWPLASVGPPCHGSRALGRLRPPRRPGPGPLRAGDAWTAGRGRLLRALAPGPLALRDVNMNSLVLRVRWRDRELWLMGDALATQERDLLDLGDPGAGRARAPAQGRPPRQPRRLRPRLGRRPGSPRRPGVRGPGQRSSATRTPRRWRPWGGPRCWSPARPWGRGSRPAWGAGGPPPGRGAPSSWGMALEPGFCRFVLMTRNWRAGVWLGRAGFFLLIQIRFAWGRVSGGGRSHCDAPTHHALNKRCGCLGKGNNHRGRRGAEERGGDQRGEGPRSRG